MKRPLVWITFFYLFGIIGGRYSLSASYSVLIFFILSSSVLILYKKFTWKGILFFPLVFLTGFININKALNSGSAVKAFVDSHQTRNFKILGTVEDISYNQDGKITCIIYAKKLIKDSNSIEKPIKIKAYINSKQKIEWGDFIEVEGEISEFEPCRNPGGWNEAVYMKSRRIEYKFYGELSRVITSSDSASKLIFLLRERLSNVYECLLAEKEAAIIKAMILGEKAGLGQEEKTLYQQGGILHILAISGLHISIISFSLEKLLKILKMKKIFKNLFIVSFLSIYCVLTGFGVSTIRAVIMISVILLGEVLLREHDFCSSLSFAALLILLWQPLFLWDAGFQLSFTAILGLIFISPLFKRLYFLPKSIRNLLSASLGAGFATLPIVAYHFYYISTIAFLLNIIVVPLAIFLVAFGFLAGLVGLFWIDGAAFIMGIVHYILSFYEYMLHLFLKIPYAYIITGRFSPWQMIFYYLSLFIPVGYIRLKRKNKLNKKLWIYSFIFTTFVWLFLFIKPDSFHIVFLDVGQGDSIAIHTKSKKHVLIDGGEKDSSKVLLPYLRYKGIECLDAVFLTHPDKDHLGGLVGLLKSIKIKKIYVTVKDIGSDELYRDFIIQANHSGIPCHLLKQGDKINFDELVFYCLYPENNEIYLENGWNRASMTLKMVYKEQSFLFTGDIEKEEEEKMTHQYKPMDVDFLKVPHHGSKTSSTMEFIEWCNPEYAVISCGKNNRYGHPHEEVLKRYADKNVKVINTADSGAITIYSDGKKFSIHTMLDNRGNEDDNIKRRIEKKYFSVSLLILWGGALFAQLLFGGNTKKVNSR